MQSNYEKKFIQKTCEKANAHMRAGHKIVQFGKKIDQKTYEFWLKCSCGWTDGYKEAKSYEEEIGELMYNIHLAYKPIF